MLPSLNKVIVLYCIVLYLELWIRRSECKTCCHVASIGKKKLCPTFSLFTQNKCLGLIINHSSSHLPAYESLENRNRKIKIIILTLACVSAVINNGMACPYWNESNKLSLFETSNRILRSQQSSVVLCML